MCEAALPLCITHYLVPFSYREDPETRYRGWTSPLNSRGILITLTDAGKNCSYLYIQVSPGGGRRVGVGADGRAGIDVICAEIVYGVTDAAADGAAVVPAGKTKISSATF